MARAWQCGSSAMAITPAVARPRNRSTGSRSATASSGGHAQNAWSRSKSPQNNSTAGTTSAWPAKRIRRGRNSRHSKQILPLLRLDAICHRPTARNADRAVRVDFRRFLAVIRSFGSLRYHRRTHIATERSSGGAAAWHRLSLARVAGQSKHTFQPSPAFVSLLDEILLPPLDGAPASD